MIQITAWQIFAACAAIIVTTAVFLLIAVLIGAYAVFKTKHAQIQIPFMQLPKRKQETSGSYLPPDLFDDFPGEIEPEDELSAHAKRLEDKKTGKVADLMNHLTGLAKKEAHES